MDRVLSAWRNASEVMGLNNRFLDFCPKWRTINIWMTFAAASNIQT